MVVAVIDYRADAALHAATGCAEMRSDTRIQILEGVHEIIGIQQTELERVVEIMKSPVSGVDAKCQKQITDAV